MKVFEDIIKSATFQRILWSAIVVLISFLIYHLISRFIAAKEKRSRIFSEKKNKTYLRMLRSITAYALCILTVLAILQIFGVNVSSMLAGVGIASIIVGFALQDALKDIIRGLDLISDNYYNIGDVIKYGDNTGQVLSISLRTTKIQDINSMNIVSIANRNIDQVEVDTGYLYISVPLPYELKVELAEAILRDIASELTKQPNITTAAYTGVTDLGDSALKYQLTITCDPMNKLQVRRDSLRTIMTTLEEHKLSVPYEQLVIRAKAKR